MTQAPDLYPTPRERQPETIAEIVELSPHELTLLVGHALDRIRKLEGLYETSHTGTKEVRKDEYDLAA